MSLFAFLCAFCMALFENTRHQCPPVYPVTHLALDCPSSLHPNFSPLPPLPRLPWLLLARRPGLLFCPRVCVSSCAHALRSDLPGVRLPSKLRARYRLIHGPSRK